MMKEDLLADTPHADGVRLSRRALLETLAAAGVALGIGGNTLLGPLQASAQTAAASAGGAVGVAAPDFLRLSVLLTGGQPLDAGLAARYQAALARDPAFGRATQALLRLADDSGVSHVDALLDHPQLDDALRATLKRIVSAWYLGIVGDDADVKLIAYANALMYRPTRGILDIPSYGSGPDTWGHKPVTPPVESTP